MKTLGRIVEFTIMLMIAFFIWSLAFLVSIGTIAVA
jgi:hypothetical protein